MSRISVLTCVLLLSGCAAKQPAIGPEGYKSPRYDLKVAPFAADGGVLSSEWKLDNYYEETGRWYTKRGDDYRTTYSLDEDGDGEYETKAKEDIFELRFVHRGHDGVIFLRTVPLSTDQRDKRLNVLMERYISGIAGSGYSVVALGDDPKVVEKRYAATISEEGTGTIAGLPVQVATVDIKNLDQLEMDRNAKGSRLELVLAHTKFVYDKYPDYEGGAFPVLLVAGYWNRADEFAESQPDFHDFLSRVMIGWQKGSALTYPEKAEPEAASSQRVAAGATAEEPEAPPEPPPAEDSAPAPTQAE